MLAVQLRKFVRIPLGHNCLWCLDAPLSEQRQGVDKIRTMMTYLTRVLMTMMSRMAYSKPNTSWTRDRTIIRYPSSRVCQNCSPVRSRRKRSTDGDIARLEEEYLEKTNKETAKALLEARGGWQPNTVTGPQQWVTFSAMLTSSLSSDQMIRDFATFIYCKLNHPDSKDY